MQTNELATTQEETARINTPLNDEVAARRLQPTSQKGDLANEMRNKIEEWRRQREAIEAFETTVVKNDEQSWALRQASRMKRMEDLHAQMAKTQSEDEDDRIGLRDRVKITRDKMAVQLAAIDDLISGALDFISKIE